MTVPGRKWAAQDSARKLAILKAVIGGKTRFNDIWAEVRGSRTSLKLYLDALKKENLINRTKTSHKNVQYTISKGAFSHPLLRNLIFENGAYLRILRELIAERAAYISKERVVRQDEERREAFVFLDLDPEYIAEKSEGELVQAIDKWLTPIVLYAIVQELKTGDKWTEAAYGVTKKLTELSKQKNVDKFEEALRTKYSRRLVQKHFFLPSEKIPIIDSLDDMLEYIKTHKEIELHEEEMKRRKKHRRAMEDLLKGVDEQ